MKQPSPLNCCRLLAVAVLVLSLATLTLPIAHGQETPAATVATNTAISIDALVFEALAKNLELKFYEAEIIAAKAGRKTAGLLPNPEVSSNVGQKTVRDAGLRSEGVAWSVSVVQPFEWPGRIGLRKAIANHDIELAELGYARFKLVLAGRVRTLAYGLFAAQEKAAAASEVAARFHALREVLVQRDPAGLTPLLEMRIIEATELNAQRKASESLLAVQVALLELNQLRGVVPGARLSVAQTDLLFRPAEKIEALSALARTNNFELRVRAVELAQQGFRVDLAKNERYPAISIGPILSEERNGNSRERIIGVGVSVPIPLWNQNKGNIEAAAARRMQAEVSFAVTEREIQRKVIESAVAYETKLREMAKLRPDAVQHFKEAAEVADRHYRLGAVPIATYIELQKQCLEAAEGLLNTKREALEAAAQLEQLTGLSLLLVNANTVEKEK